MESGHYAESQPDIPGLPAEYGRLVVRPITQGSRADCLILGRVRGMNEQHGIDDGRIPW